MELDDGRHQAVPQRRRPVVPRARPAAPTRSLTPTLEVQDLRVYEANGDGHTIRRHCDPTPGADALRLADNPWLPATGSFLSVPVAQAAVEECVAANRDLVLAWRESAETRLVLTHDTGRVIGDVLRRRDWLAGNATPRPATAVLVVLRRNTAYPAGFAVRTAYPVRHDAVAAVSRPVRIALEETRS